MTRANSLRTGRPRRYPSDTCYAPGCARRNEVSHTRCYYGTTPKLSKFCAKHRTAEELARLRGMKTPVAVPAGIPVSEVYIRWGKDVLCDVWYDVGELSSPVQVVGMKPFGSGYELTLADCTKRLVRGDTALAPQGIRTGKREAGEEML